MMGPWSGTVFWMDAHQGHQHAAQDYFATTDAHQKESSILHQLIISVLLISWDGTFIPSPLWKEATTLWRFPMIYGWLIIYKAGIQQHRISFNERRRKTCLRPWKFDEMILMILLLLGGLATSTALQRTEGNVHSFNSRFLHCISHVSHNLVFPNLFEK